MVSQLCRLLGCFLSDGDEKSTSKRLRDVIVTLVGLSINWWAFTEAQKDRRASLLGFLNGRSQFASPVSTMSFLVPLGLLQSRRELRRGVVVL